MLMLLASQPAAEMWLGALYHGVQQTQPSTALNGDKHPDGPQPTSRVAAATPIGVVRLPVASFCPQAWDAAAPHAWPYMPYLAPTWCLYENEGGRPAA